MSATLRDGGRIYLHCSAGIHRTGMIAAALLFHLGHDDEQTRAILAALRPLTASDVGEARLDWARSFG
jgi:protein tyrosine/serine phosphatase